MYYWVFIFTMAYFYTELVVNNAPFSLTTDQVYNKLNYDLDNGILCVIENIERTPCGRRKTFVVCATCRIHNPIFKTADIRDRITVHLIHNGKKERLRFNVTIPEV
jgi:hypothetical protein